MPKFGVSGLERSRMADSQQVINQILEAKQVMDDQETEFTKYTAELDEEIE